MTLTKCLFKPGINCSIVELWSLCFLAIQQSLTYLFYCKWQKKKSAILAKIAIKNLHFMYTNPKLYLKIIK